MTKEEKRIRAAEYFKKTWYSMSKEERQRRTKLAHEKYRAKPEKRAVEKAWRDRPEVRAKMLQTAHNFHRNNLERRIFLGAKRRALKMGIPFSIEMKDVIVPSDCPVLGIALKVGSKSGSAHGGNASSPTLDRKIPKLGYVPGNVFVISLRANALKNSATIDELEKIIAYCRC